MAVAAETLKQAEAAVAAMKVEYEPLPVMTTPDEALAAGACRSTTTRRTFATHC